MRNLLLVLAASVSITSLVRVIEIAISLLSDPQVVLNGRKVPRVKFRYWWHLVIPGIVVALLGMSVFIAAWPTTAGNPYLVVAWFLVSLPFVLFFVVVVCNAMSLGLSRFSKGERSWDGGEGDRDFSS